MGSPQDRNALLPSPPKLPAALPKPQIASKVPTPPGELCASLATNQPYLLSRSTCAEQSFRQDEKMGSQQKKISGNKVVDLHVHDEHKCGEVIHHQPSDFRPIL